jgi:hypothetical protein
MKDELSYCGLVCGTCPIYLLSREQNEEKKRKMRIDIAQQIKEHYGQEFDPEFVTDCDGCKTKGDRLFSGCKSCQIRKCANEKNIENCAYCSEYPCEKLDEFFAKDPEAKERLDKIKNTL